MIEVGAGIELGPGVIMGQISVLPAYLVTEVAEDFFVTEFSNNKFIED